MQVKGEIQDWARLETRLPIATSLSFSKASQSPLLLELGCRGEIEGYRAAFLIFLSGLGQLLYYEMERWFEFPLSASKNRPERNTCW